MTNKFICFLICISYSACFPMDNNQESNENQLKLKHTGFINIYNPFKGRNLIIGSGISLSIYFLYYFFLKKNKISNDLTAKNTNATEITIKLNENNNDSKKLNANPKVINLEDDHQKYKVTNIKTENSINLNLETEPCSIEQPLPINDLLGTTLPLSFIEQVRISYANQNSTFSYLYRNQDYQTEVLKNYVLIEALLNFNTGLINNKKFEEDSNNIPLIPILLYSMFQDNTDPYFYSIAYELVEDYIEQEYNKYYCEQKIDIIKRWTRYLEIVFSIKNFEIDFFDQNKLILLTRLFFCEHKEGNPGRLKSINYKQEKALWFLLPQSLLGSLIKHNAINELNKKYITFLLSYCYPFGILQNYDLKGLYIPDAYKQSIKKEFYSLFFEDLKKNILGSYSNEILEKMINEMQKETLDSIDYYKQNSNDIKNDLGKIFKWLAQSRSYGTQQLSIKSNDLSDMFYIDYDLITYEQGILLFREIISKPNAEFQNISDTILNSFSLYKQRELLSHCLYFLIRNFDLYFSSLIRNDYIKGTDLKVISINEIKNNIDYLIIRYPLCLYRLFKEIDLKKDLSLENNIFKYSEKYQNITDQEKEKINQILNTFKESINKIFEGQSFESLYFTLFGFTNMIQGVDFVDSSLLDNINFLGRIEDIFELRKTLYNHLEHDDYLLKQAKSLIFNIERNFLNLNEDYNAIEQRFNKNNAENINIEEINYSYNIIRDYILFSHIKFYKTIFEYIISSKLSNQQKAKLLEFSIYNSSFLKYFSTDYVKDINSNKKQGTFLEHFLETTKNNLSPLLLNTIELINAIIRGNLKKTKKLIEGKNILGYIEDDGFEKNEPEKFVHIHIPIGKVIESFNQAHLNQNNMFDSYAKTNYQKEILSHNYLDRIKNIFNLNNKSQYYMYNLVNFGGLPNKKEPEELFKKIINNKKFNDLDKIRLIGGFFSHDLLSEWITSDDIKLYKIKLCDLFNSRINQYKENIKYTYIDYIQEFVFITPYLSHINYMYFKKQNNTLNLEEIFNKEKQKIISGHSSFRKISKGDFINKIDKIKRSVQKFLDLLSEEKI